MLLFGDMLFLSWEWMYNWHWHYVVVKLCFALFAVLDIHGALRGLCGLDRARIGHGANLFEQNILTIGSLHFFTIIYTNISGDVTVTVTCVYSLEKNRNWYQHVSLTQVLSVFTSPGVVEAA